MDVFAMIMAALKIFVQNLPDKRSVKQTRARNRAG